MTESLNEGKDESSQFFLYRAEQHLVKKENGAVDWDWEDEDFAQWVEDFEEREERDREAARSLRKSRLKQLQPPRSQPVFNGSVASSLQPFLQQSYPGPAPTGMDLADSGGWQTQGRRSHFSQSGNGRGGMAR